MNRVDRKPLQWNVRRTWGERGDWRARCVWRRTAAVAHRLLFVLCTRRRPCFTTPFELLTWGSGTPTHVVCVQDHGSHCEESIRGTYTHRADFAVAGSVGTPHSKKRRRFAGNSPCVFNPNHSGIFFLMTRALTQARRASRKISRSTASLGRIVWNGGVRGLSRVFSSHASWSAKSWTAFYGPTSTQ